MAKSSSRENGKKKNGMVLKIVVAKLHKSFFLGRKSQTNNNHFDELEEESSRNVPNDVKKGHFAVIAIDNDDEVMKRFIVPLSCLTNPSFLRLLEQAAEEYGFDREGALMVPCRPSELEKIIAEQWMKESGSNMDRSSYTSQEFLYV